MPSILFICVHNACRSQIAEAICKKLVPDWTVASAGSNPSSQVDPKAAVVLRSHGLAIHSGQVPQGFFEIAGQDWDLAVAMGCGDKCLANVPAKKFIEWDIADPYDGPIELYQALYDDLSERIARLVGKIQRSASASLNQ